MLGLLARSWFNHTDSARIMPQHIQARLVDLKPQKALKRAEQEAKAKKRAEQQRRAEEEKKRAALEERKKRATEEEKKKQQAAEQRQLELAKKRAAAEERKKRAAEEEKKKKRREAAERAEKEKRRKAEAEKKRRQREEQARLDALQKAAKEEEAALRAEEMRAAAQGYEGYISNQITRTWRRSPSARNGMVVEITLHLLPTGRVADRYVTRSSGDSRFDNDALRAIDRVGVFDRLQGMESDLFDRYFRKIKLRFRPEDLRD